MHDAGGRFADSDVDLLRIVGNLVGQLPYFRRHGSRKHDGLPFFRQVIDDGFDVVEKTHVQHAVGLIQNKMLQMFKVDVARLQQRHESSGRGANNVYALLERMFLCAPGHAVVTAVNGNRTHRTEIPHAVYLLVDLQDQFAGWGNDEGV